MDVITLGAVGWTTLIIGVGGALSIVIGLMW